MSFKVKFKLQIHGAFASASSLDRYVERVFELPFVPFLGLNVEDGEDFEVYVPVEDGEIYWDATKQEFTVYVGSDKELYRLPTEPYDGEKSPRKIEEIVADYVACGWKESEL